ncbi:acyl-CoA dehydrogenase family protein [Rubricoccus marinus]|uniref:acyl-CoA dehydrogenase family protein n=1 Tax=Rubricoccus marinus TaxID=716817 RepID=UPI0015C60B3E|nr:acyl-CoA dehydrogenase family protein [Rubricoccus marinus]
MPSRSNPKSVTDYLSEVVRPAAQDAADRARLRWDETTGKWSERWDEAKGGVRATIDEASVGLSGYLDEYRGRLRNLFDSRLDLDTLALQRGLPPFAMREIRGSRALADLHALADDPLAAYIPAEYGGRGAHIKEGLAVLEATGYESLPLCLMVGINGGLFLQPVAKYADETFKKEVFRRFLDGKSMGGLMITEPDYGSDALKMKTTATPNGNGGVHIQGTKHWAGLTGWADYWLLTARPTGKNGEPGRDIGFYVADVTQPGQRITVEETFANLGLYMIPYGRNKLDLTVPAVQQLQPTSTGIKMMLDILHRSRLQFPGMAMGFLRRMRDEAQLHAEERFVGGKALADYDQVQARLAKLQADATICGAMCLYTSENAGLEVDSSSMSLAANSFKTTMSDAMHDAAQSYLQLSGANGYRQDHLAGRSVTDSRPFQIFEGSNDILYEQVADAVLKGMRKAKISRLSTYLAEREPLTQKASGAMSDLFDFDVDLTISQRKTVDLGRALAKAVAIGTVVEMGDRGYPTELISQAVDSLRDRIQGHLAHFHSPEAPGLVAGATSSPSWLGFVQS